MQSLLVRKFRGQTEIPLPKAVLYGFLHVTGNTITVYNKGKSMKRMKIWAHRGASGYAPENTMEAFSEAVRRGADGIELDVQLTKDGEIVVIHDEKLGRVSNGSGWVKDHTLKELRKLNFNKTFPEQGAARIPTLKEVYELMGKEGMLVNVELKTSIVFYEGLTDKVLELSARMGMEDKVLYSSFNHYTLLEMKQKNPAIRTGMLFEDGIVDAPVYASRLGVDAIHPIYAHLQHPGFLRQCREENLPLHVWTVNTKERFLEMQKAGVDAVITNYPDIQYW